jgi:hypothetical protein
VTVPGDDVAALAGRAIAIAETATGTQALILAQQARNHRTVRLLTVSVLLDIALSLFCVGLAVNQHNVSGAIHQSQLNSCAIGNQFRKSQVQLWDHVIAVSAAPAGETAAGRAARLRRIAGVRAYVGRHFHPVDCSRLYGN